MNTINNNDFKFRIASDFELSLVDAEDKLIAIPDDLVGSVVGTKVNPIWIHPEINVQADGPLIEFAVKPSDNFDKFNYLIEESLNGCDYILEGLRYTTLTSMRYQGLSKMQKELGCSPSYNVWFNRESKPKQLRGDKNLRTAGGHLHFDIPSHLTVKFAKALDLYLGLWSVLVDKDTDRRKLYGLAGDIRVKPYGLEYRTLSSFWVHSYSLRKNVFDLSIKAYTHVTEDWNSDYENEDIAIAINESNEQLAIDILTDTVWSY